MTILTSDTSVTVRSFTNSELSAFKACRRMWYLGYHQRLTPIVERQVGPLRLGSRVHEGLEGLYLGKDPLAVHDACVARDRALLAADVTEEELKKFESESRLGGIMLEGYVEWLAETGADAGLEVVATETKASAGLGMDSPDGPVMLLGKLDLRVRREMDGAVLFLDHKTCSSFNDVLQTMVINEQFLTYQLLDMLAGHEAPPATGSLVNMLRKVQRTARATPPFYMREEVHHSTIELDHFLARVHAEVADVLAVEAALAAGRNHRSVCYPRPSRDCGWRCDFLAACGMMEDGSDVDRFLADKYTVYNPLERYAEDPTTTEGAS